MKKNWKGEKFQKLPELEQERIILGRAANQQDREVFRKARDAKTQLLKEGRKYIVDNQIEIYGWEIDDHDGRYIVSAGVKVLRKDPGDATVQIAYSICSKKDRYSARMARGIIGSRLGNVDPTVTKKQMWRIPSETLNAPAVLVAMIENMFTVAVLTNTDINGTHIPRGLARAMRKELIRKG